MMRTLKDLWMRFARLLAAGNSAILLSMLFFCIITPLGLIKRLVRKSSHATAQEHASQWTTFSSGHDPRKPF